ncbi:MAG: hypothetical protein ACRCX2_09785 [Paraclostridium sp.]
MLNKLYEAAYMERELMLTSGKVTFLNKIKFKLVNYLANKY